MKCTRGHFSLLLLAGLGFWVVGSGCAEYDDFMSDFSGGHSTHVPQYAANSQPGNWLDHLLPDEAPGPCQHCQQGPWAPGQMTGPGANGLAYENSPPPNIPAHLYPVPTHPVFRVQPPSVLAMNRRPGEPGSMPTQAQRSPAAAGSNPGEIPFRHDSSPRTARMNPPPKSQPIPSDDAPASPMFVPSDSLEPESEVKPISAIGERPRLSIVKPSPANSAASTPLQLNAPTTAEQIGPASATAASANAPATTSPPATTPSPEAPAPAKSDVREGWHPVLHGGYTSR